MLLSIQGVGRLVKDPDVRYLPGSDNAVAVFSLATSTKYKDKEQSCFIECVIFGKRAEAVGTYLRKGAKVYVRGTLQQDVWEQDGQKRSIPKENKVVDKVILVAVTALVGSAQYIVADEMVKVLFDE